MRFGSLIVAVAPLLALCGCSADPGFSFDAGAGTPPDLFGAPPPDLFGTGGVGPKGGAVNQFLFGIIGDARPSNCNIATDYPTAVLKSAFTEIAAAGAQFVMDTGDHMFICQNGTQQMANMQMGLFTTAAMNFGKTVFMTLGNHDCVSMDNPNYCGVGGFTTVNYQAFLAANAAVSSSPYYSFDVNTDAGIARFVVIADNAWSTQQSSWLSATLSAAQTQAKYIFVFRHHPLDNTDMPDFPAITAIIAKYKKTMVVTGHTHELRLDTYNDPTGRTLIVGNGGAPLATGFTWFGYALVEQRDDGQLQVRYYDQSTNNQMGAYVLSPM